ncbi:MAG: acetate kinase [Clostridia bacterium]|nr:acetate kinase [Clostridia bacterium]MBQ8793067.1 acetate kinase [Clostridia bacterium]
MKILVINAGSSSLKYQLLDMENEKVIAKGNCEKIAIAGSFIKYKANGMEKVFEGDLKDHTEALSKVFSVLTNKEYGVVKSLDEIDAVGHRMVHGGEVFTDSVLITDEVMTKLEELIPLGPLHMPANIAGVKACQTLFKNKPQIAVFDTAFHSHMPKEAFLYGLPYEAYTDWKIRRYGFHGTSHKFVSKECAEILGKKDAKIITCHLGNGSSISAVKNGISVDTSMGMTPLAGVMMGTRSGDLDPSILETIQDKTGWSLKEIVNYLNKKSGLLGVGGVSSDMRDNENAMNQGNERAALAYKMLAYQIKKYIGSYTAAMNGVDAIVFTGGIGENDAVLRDFVCDGLDYLGIIMDKDKNKNFKRGVVSDLTASKSKVKIYVIPTNEELMIARDTKTIVNAR